MKKILILFIAMATISCSSVKKEDAVKNYNGIESQFEPIIEGKAIVDDWILIRSLTAEWKVQNNDGTHYDDHATYEFFYSESRNKFELRLEGYKPKAHSVYKRVSKLIIDVNQAMLFGDKPIKEIITMIENR